LWAPVAPIANVYNISHAHTQSRWHRNSHAGPHRNADVIADRHANYVAHTHPDADTNQPTNGDNHLYEDSNADAHPRPPTRTFTPTGPPAVELLEPQDGAQVQGEVTFRWSWAGRLGPGEIFDVRVCKGEGCQPQFGKTNVGDTTWPWQPDEGGGTYGWQVVVIRKEGDRVVAERAHSDIWRFDWSSGGGGSTTAPGPTPTR